MHFLLAILLKPWLYLIGYTLVCWPLHVVVEKLLPAGRLKRELLMKRHPGDGTWVTRLVQWYANGLLLFVVIAMITVA